MSIPGTVHRLPVILTIALGCSALAHAAPDWNKLQPGMPAPEARRLFGEPLIRSAGRGLELWIYDGQGEILFAGGPVKAWTPARPTAASLARPIKDDLLFKPARNRRLPPTQSLPQLPPVDNLLRELTSTRFRYL